MTNAARCFARRETYGNGFARRLGGARDGLAALPAAALLSAPGGAAIAGC